MWNRIWKSHSKTESTPNDEPILRERRSQPTPLEIRISEELKNEGNELFKRAKYIAAAEKYTEAITIRPNWPVALVNRANCYKKLANWKQVENDCRAAIEADPQSMKAHYFLGLALEEQQEHATALIHLEKSYDLARDKEDQVMEEIWRIIARVSYAQWETAAQHRRQEDARLKNRLKTLLLDAHRQEQLDQPHDPCLMQRQEEELEALEHLFHRAAAADQPQELPSCLTCVLTMDVFRDPVVSPSGFSYENAVLKEHLDRVGTFDPVTRQPIDKAHLVKNLNLRSAAHLYLKEHPWAWKESV